MGDATEARSLPVPARVELQPLHSVEPPYTLAFHQSFHLLRTSNTSPLFPRP